MNKAAKKRLVIVGLVIVVVALVLFAVLGAGSAATALSVDQAVSGDYEGKKVQVSGPVVTDSYTTEGTNAIFYIADEDSASSLQLQVIYAGSMPATFGNGVTAICTGTMQDGSLICTELVTKCPSKYESAEGSVTASVLLANPGVYAGVEVKLAGYVTQGSIASIDAEVRFNVYSQGSSIDVVTSGALPDAMTAGSAVIVTGYLDAEAMRFVASEVALDASVQAQ